MIGMANWLNKFRKVITGGGGSGGTTSYANNGGTGDRRLLIPYSVAGVMPSLGGTQWVDGNTSSAGQGFFPGGSVDSSSYIIFDFGSGNTVLIDEAKYYQENSTTQGVWQWRGSNDGSTWTNIGSSFTLGGVATQTITALNGNATRYRYYQLIGVSGTCSSSPWVYEFEFKIFGI